MTPSRKNTPFKSEEELLDGDQSMYLKGNHGEVGNGRKSNKRGSVGRDRSGSKKLQRKSQAAKSDVGGRWPARNGGSFLRQQQGQTPQIAREGSYIRGRRTVRKRRAENNVGEQTLLGHMRADTAGVGTGRLNESWSHEPSNAAKVEPAGDSFEDDENDNEMGNEVAMGYDGVQNWENDFAGTSNGWINNSMEEEPGEEEEEYLETGVSEEEHEEYNEHAEENTSQVFAGNMEATADAGYRGEPMEDDEEEDEEDSDSSDDSEVDYSE